MPLVPVKTKDSQDWDWEALSIQDGKVPVWIAGTDERKQSERQGIAGDVEFHHEDQSMVPNNMFPPMTSLSA